MWTYRQSTGELLNPSGICVARGYAGHGDGVNNPDLQHVPRVGPLPRGFYTITELVLKHPTLGPYVLVLEPDAGNEMFGRALFRCHGDKLGAPPRSASHGCIIVGRLIRQMLWASGDRRLYVVK